MGEIAATEALLTQVLASTNREQAAKAAYYLSILAENRVAFAEARQYMSQATRLDPDNSLDTHSNSQPIAEEQAATVAAIMHGHRYDILVVALSPAKRTELGIGDRGILVKEVYKDHTADDGVRPGDILLMLNRTDIKSVNQFINLVNTLPNRGPVSVLIQREGNVLLLVLRARDQWVEADTDKDGMISSSEAEAVPLNMPEADANMDGVLSREEFAAARRYPLYARRVNRLNLWVEADTDKDGMISRSEAEAAGLDMPVADANMDGVLSLEEFAAAIGH